MKPVYSNLLLASTLAFGLISTSSLFAQPALKEAVSYPNALSVTIPVTTASDLNKQLSFYKNKYPARYNNRTLKVTFLFNPKVKNDYTGEELKNIIDATNSYPNILFLNDITVKIVGETSNVHLTPEAETLINQINHLPLTAEAPIITFRSQAHFTAYDMMKILISLARTPVINIISPRLSDQPSQAAQQTTPSSKVTTMIVTVVNVTALRNDVSLRQCQELMTSHTETFINDKSTGKIIVSPTHFMTDMNRVSQLIIPNNGVMNEIQGNSHLLIHHAWQTTPSYLTLYQTGMSNEVYGFLANQYCIASVHGNIKPL